MILSVPRRLAEFKIMQASRTAPEIDEASEPYESPE
jgi:hypothetical protein